MLYSTKQLHFSHEGCKVTSDRREAFFTMILVQMGGEIMKRPRWPQQVYQRRLLKRRTAKQRIHEMLRENALLSVEQLAQAVGCPRAYARIWRKNFFALESE